MNNLSIAINWLFAFTTFITVWQFYRAAGKSNKVLTCIIILLLLQTVLGLSGFFHVTGAIPPRFALLIGPGLIICLLLFITSKGRVFINSLNMQHLTLMHTIRIPVEFTLYFVFIAGYIPEIMTFEGRNLDVISGITAPVMYYLVFVRKKLSTRFLLFWNFLCLGLLLNVMIIAILSAQTPFQQLAFDQPNIGVTYFPFVWLPGIIVPIVLLGHLASIAQLLSVLKKRNVLATATA